MVTSVLITGANRGIGLEFARQYAADGWAVHACCRRPADARKLHILNARVHQLDVADRASIDALASGLADTTIDVLINNAGIYGGSHQDFGETDHPSWEATVRTNVIGPFRIVEALEGSLARSERAIVAQISSLAGSIGDNHSGGSHIYRTSKTALNMVTANLARDLAGRNITVMALHPGWVKTDMGGTSAPLGVTESVTRMRRLIASADIARSGGFFDRNGERLPW